MSKTKKLTLATADCETDPFEYPVIVQPFVWGFYSDAEGYCHFWGEGETRDEQERSATETFIDFLYKLESPHIIYMHNGGKFDFRFLLSFIEGSLKIVNGRILECRIGSHVLRDSYAAIPIPLAAYKKDKFDYLKLKLNVRQKNKSEIIHYLRNDCVYLYEMVSAFRDEFGDILTIGTAAMRALKVHHEFEEFSSENDAFFRNFYYGGRNQCFEKGEVKASPGNVLKVFDVNSMYPHCMASMLHPVSRTYDIDKTLTDLTDFIIVTGENYGALPFKDKFGLDFTRDYGTFHATGHELRAALDTGTFKIDRIESAYTFTQRTTFDAFVQTYFSKRLASKAAGEDLYVLFWKLILNSAYGKFCLNSENFKDWFMTEADEFLDDSIWTIEHDNGEYILWSKPTTQTKFLNVATGASITGAARSQLLRGLSQAVRPVYCDTDSIICEDFQGETDSKRLGAWKYEAHGDCIYIAGKKLYALYQDNEPWFELDKDGDKKFKQASKGARLTGEQIKNAALGGMTLYENPVPCFNLNGGYSFGARRIRMTGKDVLPFAFNKP